MMDKIPFEEWALKSIDPPSISSKIRPAEGPRDKSQTGSTTESEEKNSSHYVTLSWFVVRGKRTNEWLTAGDG